MTDADDYKAHANLFKDEGNAAFEAGDIEKSIHLYSQAIDIDPDNHVFYSNRSAAYMKVDSKSKALWDAEKCVSLAPNWSKGYNRLGVAQQSLRRFDAAIETFKKGIERDPNNQTLWSALRSAEEAFAVDKKARFEAAAKEREEEEERQRIRNYAKTKPKESAKKEDDLLSSFFADVTAPSAPAPTATLPANLTAPFSADIGQGEVKEEDLLSNFFSEITASKEEATAQAEAKNEKVLTDKYSNVDLGSAKDQLARITAPHYQWRNLNPYYVLQLDIDATDEDIKYRYRKLSGKVHPDKLRDVPLAREGFEEVKQAYQKLCDEKLKATIIMNIEHIREETRKDRKRLLSKGMKEPELWDLEEETTKRMQRHFAEMEMLRRSSEQNIRSHNARERMQADEEKEKALKAMEFENDWSDLDRREKRVGTWRDFQEDPSAKKKAVASYKEQVRVEEKHGTVDMNSWRKKWK